MAYDRVETGNPWEKSFGYCRAVRAGNTIYVSGTAARADDWPPSSAPAPRIEDCSRVRRFMRGL